MLASCTSIFQRGKHQHSETESQVGNEREQDYDSDAQGVVEPIGVSRVQKQPGKVGEEPDHSSHHCCSIG